MGIHLLNHPYGTASLITMIFSVYSPQTETNHIWNAAIYIIINTSSLLIVLRICVVIIEIICFKIQ